MVSEELQQCYLAAEADPQEPPTLLPVSTINPTNDPRRKKRNPNQLRYCHTHGACNHDSPDCRSKAEGHKDEATFQNQMGGSTKNIKA